MGGKMSTIEDCRASVATTTPSIPAAFAPNYGTCAASQKAALQERTISISSYLPPSHKGCDTNNRIISFHAKASWFGYLEASKALNNLVVIDFTNACYEPCRYMEQVFNAFAAAYTNVEFVKIDVDDLFDISRQYGVQTTPTFLFIKKGKEIDRVVGARKNEVQRKIEKHIWAYRDNSNSMYSIARPSS